MARPFSVSPSANNNNNPRILLVATGDPALHVPLDGRATVVNAESHVPARRLRSRECSWLLALLAHQLGAQRNLLVRVRCTRHSRRLRSLHARLRKRRLSGPRSCSTRSLRSGTGCLARRRCLEFKARLRVPGPSGQGSRTRSAPCPFAIPASTSAPPLPKRRLKSTR
jgi:hypothetical protein